MTDDASTKPPTRRDSIIKAIADLSREEPHPTAGPIEETGRVAAGECASDRAVLGSMRSSTPMAVFATDEDLLHALAQAKASLALSGLELTPEEEAMLVQAFRKGWSHEEYGRRVYESVFFGGS